jgi:hypothetical protein
MVSHPYEPATPEEAEGGISDSEAQMLARELAKAKDRVEELEAVVERLWNALRRIADPHDGQFHDASHVLTGTAEVKRLRKIAAGALDRAEDGRDD